MSDAEPTFSALDLDPALVRALDDLGFEHPTPIQAEAIPPLRQGRDIVARARTGSGKTAAFGLPLLELLKDGKPGPRALILAPTRELALQVTEALESLARHLRVPMVTVYGGAPYRPQLIALKRGVPVVVGTPGRLIDHLERGSLDLSAVEIVVIDEADEMLRMGFIDDVEKLLAATPDGRQVALFSATMPPAIRRVANKHLNDPVTVEADVARGTTVDHVRQRALVVPQNRKAEALIRYLRGEDRGAALVFSRTRAGCGELAERLAEGGIEAEALHGDLAQNERERVLNRLRSGRIGVVVATDVASRGIDIDHITHVINMDLPDNPESYTHRIGRTGRAGREGTALTLVAPRARGRAESFRRSLGATFEDYTLPTDAQIAQKERAALVEALAGAGEAAAGWVEHLVQEGTAPEALAAAALELLARERGVSLERDLPDVLPDWALGRPPRRDPPARPFRGDGPSPRGGPQQGPPRGRPDGPLDEVELFIGAGRSMGVRPGDLVGALAGDAGITGRDIGRIQVGERSSFVGVSKAVARTVLDGRGTLNVRGRDVKLGMAHPGGKTGGPSLPPGRPRGPGKPPFSARPHKGGPRPGKGYPKGGAKPWKGSGGKR